MSRPVCVIGESTHGHTIHVCKRTSLTGTDSKSGLSQRQGHFAAIDPKMMLSLPAKMTMARDVDALLHALEPSLSKTSTTVTQALASVSTTLIWSKVTSTTVEKNIVHTFPFHSYPGTISRRSR